MLVFRFPDPGVGHSKLACRKPRNFLSIRPSTPAPPMLSVEHAPTFDSDDEYEPDDSIHGFGASSSSPSFRKRPLNLQLLSSLASERTAPKKAVSLLAVQLKRRREHADGGEGWEWLSAEGESAEIIDSRREERPVSQPTKPICPKSVVRPQPPRPTGRFALAKRFIATNLRLRLRNGCTTNSRDKQPAQHAAAAARKNDGEESKHGENSGAGSGRDPKPQQEDAAVAHHQRHAEPYIYNPPRSAPITIPLSPKQKEEEKEREFFRIPLQTACRNDRNQICRAGWLPPRPGPSAGYIERDIDWVCCGCSTANSRYEFLCGGCGVHMKGACCEEVMEGVDGVAGFGLGGMW